MTEEPGATVLKVAKSQTRLDNRGHIVTRPKLIRVFIKRNKKKKSQLPFGFPRGSDGKKKKICLQYKRPRFDPWVGKIPWRWKRLPPPVFLPGEFHGHRSPVSNSP